jgi:hypothetical protein
LPTGRIGEGSRSCEGLRAQIVEARRALVAYLQYLGGMVQALGPSAAGVEDLALALLSHVNGVACIGLGRPVGFSCFNPTCGNLQGLSELGLVVPGVTGAPRREGAGVCGRCKAGCYCNRFCQRHHWEDHRAFCRSSFGQQQLEGFLVHMPEYYL